MYAQKETKNSVLTSQSVTNEKSSSSAYAAQIKSSPLQFKGMSSQIRTLQQSLFSSHSSGAVMQFAGEYRKMMPEHSSSHPVKYKMTHMVWDDNTKKYKEETKALSDYTYHHIIPENKWEIVYNNLKNYIDSSTRKVPTYVHNFIEAGRKWSLEAQIMNNLATLQTFFHDDTLTKDKLLSFYDIVYTDGHNIQYKFSTIRYNQYYKNYNKNLKAEIDSLLSKRFVNIVTPRNYQEVISILEDKYHKDLSAFNQNMFNYMSLNGMTSNKIDINQLTSDLYKFLQIEPPNELDINHSSFSNNQKSLLTTMDLDTPDQYTYETTGSSKSELRARMAWIVGNIHQGPKSDLRISPGNEAHKLDRDDGGNSFETSAKKVLSEDHYKKIVQLNILVEFFTKPKFVFNENDEIHRNKLEEMFTLMTTLMNADYFTTFNEENSRKWVYDENTQPAKPKSKKDYYKGSMRFPE